MRGPVAPWWHTGIVLIVIAAAIVLSISAHGTASGADDHGGIPLYLSVIGFEWVLFGLTWVGTRKRATLRELLGARWLGRRAFFRSVLITIAFWLVWEGTDEAMHWLLHSSEPPNVAAMLPRTPGENLRLDTALDVGGNLRRVRVPRLPPATVCRTDRQRDGRIGPAGRSLWRIARVSGLEAGRLHHRVGRDVRRAGSMATVHPPWHGLARLE